MDEWWKKEETTVTTLVEFKVLHIYTYHFSIAISNQLRYISEQGFPGGLWHF